MEKSKYLPRLHANLAQKIEFISICRLNLLRYSGHERKCKTIFTEVVKLQNKHEIDQEKI